MEEKTAAKKQPFEAHPKLAELLLHAAHNWETDGRWSATLEEINKVCSTLTRYETLPAKLAQLKVRGKIDEIDEAFNLGIDKAIGVVNALPQQNTGLQDKIDRYEMALREIAKMTVSDSMRDIASNALNDK